MGFDAELGPLDVQVQDTDRENVMSALDEVHTLERLNAAALEIFDQTMLMLYMRTRKRVESLLPLSLQYTASILKPLIKNIDAVHYTQMSRTLQVAEQYAVRLLSSGESPIGESPISIAGHLVEQYPEHGFVIDSDEARRIGLRAPVLTEELSHIFDALIPHIETGKPIVGQFKEVESDSSDISVNEGENCTHDTEHPSGCGDGHRPVEGE